MEKDLIIKQAKEALDRAVSELKVRRALTDSIGKDLSGILAPFLEAISLDTEKNRKDFADAMRDVLKQMEENSKITRQEFKDALDNIVDIKVPTVNVPTPEVTIYPTFNVPTPEVSVSVPEIKVPELKWPKEEMPIKGWVGLMGVDINKPLPVQIRDMNGKPVDLFGNTTIMGGGGGAKYVKISNTSDNPVPVTGTFTASAPATTYVIPGNRDGVIYNGDNPLPVTIASGGTATTAVQNLNADGTYRDTFPVQGTVAVSGITNSVAASLVDSSGVQYSGSNPLPISGSLSVSPWGTYYASDAVGSVHIVDVSIESALNSSTATLGIGGVFTGLAEDITDYSAAKVVVYSDVASATNGLSLQQSPDGSNWDITDVYTIPAATGKVFNVPFVARYFRIVYTNGGTGQASFRLATLLKNVASAPSSQRPSDARTNDNDFVEMLSFNNVYNPTTDQWNRVRGDQGYSGPGVMRVVHATDVGMSVSVSGSTGTLATALVDSSGVSYNSTNGLPIRLASGTGSSLAVNISDSSGVAYSGSNPVPVLLSGAVGSSSANLIYTRQTNPTAIAADYVPASADDLGRQLVRPLQVRDLMATAYVAVSNGTETTLLAASTGVYHDLVWITLANNSTVAVGVDLRAVSAGNVIAHYEIPANSTTGFSATVGYPLAISDESGNAWTIDLPDITGTTVYASALFTKEI